MTLVAMVAVMTGKVAQVAAAGGKGIVPKGASRGGEDASVPAGLPDTSDGVPAVAGMPAAEPATAPAEIPGGGSSDEQSGETPFDAGEWFDDSMPEYFRPARAQELDGWMDSFRHHLRQAFIKGTDKTRKTFIHMLHMIDNEVVRQEVLADLIGWAVRSRHHQALVSLKRELVEVEEIFLETFSKWLSGKSAEKAWNGVAQQLTGEWKGALKVVEEEFRERAQDNAQQVFGMPSGAAMAGMLRRRRRRHRRKARRTQTGGANEDGGEDSSDSSSEGSDTEEKSKADDEWENNGGGKPRAKP